MRLLGVTTSSPVTPQTAQDADPARRREICGEGNTYEQAYQHVTEQVPDGWRLLHVRRGD